MNSSMITAAVSMNALQRKLDMLADNMANLNTVGYKRKSSVFEDVLTSINQQNKDFVQPGRRTPLGITEGWGARLSSIMLDLSQGPLQETGVMTDVAIEGNGLFEVRTGGTIDSPPAFTKHGAFHLEPIPGEDGARMLVTSAGNPVVGQNGGTDALIVVPKNYDLSIQPDGTLLAVGAQGSTPIELGKLKVTQPIKPELLQAIGENLYGVPTGINVADVLADVTYVPGETSGIAVRQGFLENSNVSLTDEMADLMIVQRAYQLSARALSSSDEMMGLANNLRG